MLGRKVTLGGTRCVSVAPEWQRHHTDAPLINEAVVYKLMRSHQQSLKPNHEYWLIFEDAVALKRRATGEEAEFRVEERKTDPFMLGLDWCSTLRRKQLALKFSTTASVIIAVQDVPMLGWVFEI